MSYKKSFLLIAVTTVVFMIASCKKEDDPPSAKLVGSWKMTGYIHDNTDVYGAAIGPCIIDNILTFYKDYTVTEDEGSTKCDASDMQLHTGTYKLENDNKYLTITAGEDYTTSEVLTLNTTTLKVKMIDGGDIITYTRIE